VLQQHPPYSSDFPNIWLFPKLKSALKGTVGRSCKNKIDKGINGNTMKNTDEAIR